jgi:hypothetical protein
VIDLYSYDWGQWFTEITANSIATSAGQFGDTLSMFQMIRDVQDPWSTPSEALALIDGTAEPMRSSSIAQALRVQMAGAISREAYERALDEANRRFPRDPTVANRVIDAALAGGDFDTALDKIDIVDAAVGGDPFLNVARVEVYLRRLKAGDLEKAAAAADAAAHDEPSLSQGWRAKLDVAVAREKWLDAVAVLDVLLRRFKLTLDEAALRGSPRLPLDYSKLFDSPEYIAWRNSRL